MDKSTIRVSDVEVDSYQIHLNEAGDPKAPPILFLHGSGPGATAASNWDAVMRAFEHEFYCVAPDILGFGDSTHPNPPPQGIVPYTQLRVDVLLSLLDVLGIERAHFVGNSMGGILSLHAVRQSPGRVDKLVLMGSGGAPVAPGPSLPLLVGFYEDPSTEAMAALLREFLHDPDVLGNQLEDIADERLPMATRTDVERSHRATFDLTEMWSISEAELAAIQQEVMIIQGREDRMVTLDASLYFFERIQNARLYGIGRCGHWVQVEQLEKFVAALRGFLSGKL